MVNTDPGMVFGGLGLLLLVAAIVALVWLMRRLDKPFDGPGAADRGGRRAVIVLLLLVAFLAGVPGVLLTGVGLFYALLGGQFEQGFGWAIAMFGVMALVLAAPFGIGARRALQRGAWS